MTRSGIEVDPTVLAHLLAAQRTVSGLSAYQGMAELVCRAVEGIPGVGACVVCLPGSDRPRLGGEPIASCADCDLPGNAFSGDGGYRCQAPGTTGARALPLEADGRHLGAVLVEVSDAEPYAPYELFVDALVDSLAVTVARQWQKDRWATVHDALLRERAQLQELVEERTVALRQAKVRLGRAETEIAERKQVTEALERSNKSLREAQQLAQLGHWHWDVKTGDVEWSEELFRIFRLDPSTFTPHIDAILALSPWPEERERGQELIQRAMASRESGSYEQRFLRSDGTEGYYQSTFQGTYDDADGLVAIVGTVVDITDRKRAAEALRESEEKFAMAFQTSPYAITITRPEDGAFADVNDAFTSMCGYSREEALASSSVAMKLWAREEDRQRVVAALGAGQTVDGEEFRFCTRSGGTVIGLFSARIMRLRQGLRILSSIEDVTRRRMDEVALRKAHRQLDTVLSSLYAGVLAVSEGGRVELVNQAFCDLFSLSEAPAHFQGLTATEMLQRIADQYASPAETLARIREIAARRKPAKGEEVVMRDGRVLLVDFIPVVVDGRSVGRIWHHQDITDRRRAEERLSDSEEKYRTLIDQAADAIVVVGPDGRLQEVNSRASKLFGYSAEEFCTLSVSEIVEAAEVPRQMEALRSIALGESVLAEGQFRRRDGSAFPGALSACRTADGRVLGIIRDISERRRAEAERAKLEEQLRASQKMEAIGSLAGGVAHDFNNLLSVILSYTGFAMEEAGEGGSLQDDLLEVKKAAERAAALTRQLLAFSRKQVLQPVSLDLNRIATGLEKMFRRILGEDIDLVQVLAADLGVVKADPGQVEQVVMNLVVNARDAMPDGGKLTIVTSNVEIDEDYTARHMAVEAGSYVQIAITDTGSGMNAETSARIFEPFFTTKKQGKGTGLGLSTAYGIVRQSGGHIWVYSEVGQGTTFKVYLPRELSPPAAKGTKSSVVSRAVTGTETILVVEDEEALRKVARRSLENAGYTVLTAADGAEALSLCRQEPATVIHLLLTDVVMPRMSGRALAQELSLARPTIKVIYMSGYTDNAIVHHGVLDAGVHFLPKPFTSTDLTKMVRAVLDTSPPASH